MLKKLNVVLVIVAFSLCLPTVGACAAEPATKAAAKSDVAAKQDDMVRGVLIALQNAIASRDVEKTAKLFAEDVIFIDESGEEVRGQKALAERFAELYKSGSLPVVGIHPQSMTFPADSVGLIVGEVSRKLENEHLPLTRFSMVVVKKGTGWVIQEVTETAMKSTQSLSHLQDLSWMIGQWSTEKDDSSAKLVVEWAPAKKFITSRYTLNKRGAEPQVDTQVIGWDPQHNSIVSWHFDANGGFGSGTWTKHPGESKWTVTVAGVSADGGSSVANNVFLLKTTDEFVWQSVNRSLDGVAVDDTPPITVHRVKP
jgi:hypothetical protein